MLQKIREELNSYFLEREEEIDIALTSILAKEHTLFLGPPGTGKSQLVRAIASHIKAKYFEKLITKFTTEEEIFGPISIKELKENDRLYRKTKNFLPDCEIAFLDEIFKANSSILNSLLTIMNERIFHNADTIERAKIITIFGASNELPDNSLYAFYDRFLFRKVVEGIKSYENLIKLINLDEEYKAKTKVSIKKIKNLQEKAKDVDISEVVGYLIDIRKKLEQNHIYISDRRFKKGVKAIKCYSLIRGNRVAEIEDLEILRYIFWEDIDDIPIVSKIIFNLINKYSERVLELLEVIKELKKELRYINVEKISECKKDYNMVIELLSKMAKIRLELKKLRNEALLTGKSVKLIDKAIKESDEFNKYIEVILNEL
ncbi:AAA family ATPase [Methanocaldococcus infernus]